VRRGGPADLDRIAELAGDLLPEAGSAESLAATLQGPAAELWVGGVAPPDAAAAPDAPDEIDGFLLALRVGPELEILWLAVACAARRQGLARGLLGSALTGAEVCHLEVAEERSGARAFYRTEGFLAVGRRSAYQPGGGDAIRMRWTAEGMPPG